MFAGSRPRAPSKGLGLPVSVAVFCSLTRLLQLEGPHTGPGDAHRAMNCKGDLALHGLVVQARAVGEILFRIHTGAVLGVPPTTTRGHHHQGLWVA